MAQHKGKEFDDPFYRFILSMNVHHFLRLKDEMEDAVSLKGRGKKHGERHLQVELREMMKKLRDEEVNKRRPGRHCGFEAVDDFAAGYEILKKDKIKNFITRSFMHMDILGLNGTPTTNLPEESMASDLWCEFREGDILNCRDVHDKPPAQMMSINDELLEQTDNGGGQFDDEE